MANLPLDARVLLESGGLAHMVTLNPDGWPQVSCVWVGLDGEEIVSGHLPRNRKVKNVERDPRVVISIEGARDNELGLREYLVVRGHARSGSGASVPGPTARSSLRPQASLLIVRAHAHLQRHPADGAEAPRQL